MPYRPLDGVKIITNTSQTDFISISGFTGPHTCTAGYLCSISMVAAELGQIYSSFDNNNNLIIDFNLILFIIRYFNHILAVTCRAASRLPPDLNQSTLYNRDKDSILDQIYKKQIFSAFYNEDLKF